MKNRILGMFICIFLTVFTGITLGQNMTVKDSDTNVLMQVEDKGTTGALSVSGVSTDSVEINSMGAAPDKTADKLYNVGGSLYWNGSALGMSGSAGGWTDGGANVYTTASTDNVGIGTSSPAAKLDIQGTLNVGLDDTGYDVNFHGAESGSRMFWDESQMAFRAGRVTGTQWDDTNIGYCSAAVGYNTTANASYSTAMGRETIANHTASTAMGWGTIASGNYSIAMGYKTKAESWGSTAIGRYNVGGGNAMTWVDTDPLFEIGIGTDDVSRANALTVLKNGDVGMNTTNPDEKLQVDGRIFSKGNTVDDGIVIGNDKTNNESAHLSWQNNEGLSIHSWGRGFGDQLFISGNSNKVGVGTTSPAAKLDVQGTLNVGVDDTGYDVNFYGAESDSRMFWDESKMAFRAGTVLYGTEWDDANVGLYSFAVGLGATASGYFSAAIGQHTTAGGNGSIAMGSGTEAYPGATSTAMGQSTTAYGDVSTAMGYSTLAGGNFSTAMGGNTKAESDYSTAIGRYNVGGGTLGQWVDTESLFEIGNGDGESSRANAVTVLKNGNVGIGTATPDYLLEMESSGGGFYDISDHSWHNASSRNLKQDIVPNQMNILEILDQVDIVNYRFKTAVAEDPNAPYHIGFIAEDTLELLSGKDQNSMATGDCIGLLLATVKEQQEMIDTQEEIISDLQEQIRRIQMQLELVSE